MEDKFNKFFKKLMLNDKNSSILYCCFFLFILVLTPILSKKYYDVVKNPLFQVMSLVIIILVAFYNKNLAIIIFMAYAISYSYALITSYNEYIFDNFTGTLDLDVNISDEENSYFDFKYNPSHKIKNVAVLWGSNYLGREIGLNK